MEIVTARRNEMRLTQQRRLARLEETKGYAIVHFFFTLSICWTKYVKQIQ